jgi:UDP:flavonoid glycosyltransferase YjiC (YdhE family)
MVCLPFERDQPVNAKAVERVGAGVALDASASVEEVRAAVLGQSARTDRVCLPGDPVRAADVVAMAAS